MARKKVSFLLIVVILVTFVTPWFTTTLGGKFTPGLLLLDAACYQLQLIDLKPELNYDDYDDSLSLQKIKEYIKETLRDIRSGCNWAALSARRMSMLTFGSTEKNLQWGMLLALAAAILTLFLPIAATAWAIGLALIYQNAWGLNMGIGFWLSCLAIAFALIRSIQ